MKFNKVFILAERAIFNNVMGVSVAIVLGASAGSAIGSSPNFGPYAKFFLSCVVGYSIGYSVGSLFKKPLTEEEKAAIAFLKFEKYLKEGAYGNTITLKVSDRRAP